MLKKTLIGIGALIGVVITALALLALFFPANRFKPQIEQYVKDNYKRTLTIDGDLKLSVFPRIALALPRTTLSNQAGDRVAASLDSARVSVALFPLIRGRIEVDRIYIAGLKASVERRRDGSTSVDDLIKREAEKATPPADEGNQPAPQFEIGGIDLSEAQLAFNDLQSGANYTLSRLNLSTGRIAPQGRTPVEFATNFAVTKPAVNGEARMKADFDIDLPANAFAINDGEAAVKASMGKESYDAVLTLPKLSFAEALSGERLALTLKLAGSQSGEIKLVADQLTGTRQQGQIDKLAIAANIAANVQQGARKVVANLASPLQFNIDAQTAALPKLGGDIDIDDPVLPQKSLKLPIAGEIAVDAKKQDVRTELSTKFDDTALNLKLNIANFDKPALRFDAQADQLNIDRYFPPAAAAKPDASKGDAGKAAPAKQADAKQTDTPIDLSVLKDLNMNGEARIGKLQVRGIKAANVRVGVKALNGRLDLAPINAKLYDGALAGNAFANASGNRIGLDVVLSDVSVNPLLKDAAQNDLLEGRGNIKLAVAGAGATVEALRRSLDGAASLALRDGAVKGINIPQKLREARALLTGGATQERADTAQKTDFSSMSASFQIKDGVAESNDLDARSPLLRLGGGGQVDVGAGNIDYTAKVSVVGTLKGQDGREINELRGVTVPLRLTGPFDGLNYGIDWSGVAQEALKSKVADELKQKLSPQAKEQQQKLEQRARDALKGILK